MSSLAKKKGLPSTDPDIYGRVEQAQVVPEEYQSVEHPDAASPNFRHVSSSICNSYVLVPVTEQWFPSAALYFLNKSEFHFHKIFLRHCDKSQVAVMCLQTRPSHPLELFSSISLATLKKYEPAAYEKLKDLKMEKVYFNKGL